MRPSVVRSLTALREVAVYFSNSELSDMFRELQMEVGFRVKLG
jgi:hypothetical protein